MASEPYSDEDRIALDVALVLAFNAYEQTRDARRQDPSERVGPPTTLYAEAEIEWDGQFEQRRYRFMSMDRLNLADLHRAVKAIRAALQRGAELPAADLADMLTQALDRRYRAQVRLRRIGRIQLRP